MPTAASPSSPLPPPPPAGNTANIIPTLSNNNNNNNGAATTMTTEEWLAAAAAARALESLQASARARREARLREADRLLSPAITDGGAAETERRLARARRAEVRAALLAERAALAAEVAALQRDVRMLKAAAAAGERAGDTDGEEGSLPARAVAARGLRRARAVAALARCRQQRTLELAQLFPVTLGTPGHARAELACDRIRGLPLPDGPRPSSTAAGLDAWVAAARAPPSLAAAVGSAPAAPATARAEAEARGLGLAAQLVVALAAVHECPLPHAIIAAGAHSRIARAPGPPPPLLPLLLTDALSLPLCGAVKGAAADDRGPAAALALLIRDIVALARAMGKAEEEGIASCGMRVGLALHTLLCE